LKRFIYARLSPHSSHMETSPYGDLPELTNSNGAFCKDSCVVQAWSSATLLDTLFDLHCIQDGLSS
jgi:glycogen debranching enzyme